MNPKVICHLTLSHNRDPSKVGLQRQKLGATVKIDGAEDDWRFFSTHILCIF